MADGDLTGQASYSPGSWVAIVGPRAWLLIDHDASGPVVADCWSQARGGAGIDELLAVIVHEGFRSIPNFALVAGTGDGLTLRLRGTARAAVTLGSGEVELVDASQAAMWVERAFTEPLTVTISSGSGVAAALSLPVYGGVVLAEQLTIAVSDQVDAGGSASQSGSDVAPVAALPSEAPGPSSDTVPTPDVEPISLHKPEEAESEPTADEPAAEARPVDDLFGATQLLPVFDDETPSAPAGSATGDSDPLPPATVLAAYCLAGHLTPATAVVCRVCQQPVPPQEPFTAPRPVLGVLQLSTGGEVALDRGVILGRAPSAPDGSLPGRPHVVRLASPDNDISRTHVEVRLDGWHVLVTDLGSTNGTFISAPGLETHRLAANDPEAIGPGTEVSLADEMSFRYVVTG